MALREAHYILNRDNYNGDRQQGAQTEIQHAIAAALIALAERAGEIKAALSHINALWNRAGGWNE